MALQQTGRCAARGAANGVKANFAAASVGPCIAELEWLHARDMTAIQPLLINGDGRDGQCAASRIEGTSSQGKVQRAAWTTGSIQDGLTVLGRFRQKQRHTVV